MLKIYRPFKIIDDETMAIVALLKWQQLATEIPEFVSMADALRRSCGKSVPVVVDDYGKTIACGFHELYKYLEKQGLFLC